MCYQHFYCLLILYNILSHICVVFIKNIWYLLWISYNGVNLVTIFLMLCLSFSSSLFNRSHIALGLFDEHIMSLLCNMFALHITFFVYFRKARIIMFTTILTLSFFIWPQCFQMSAWFFIASCDSWLIRVQNVNS